MAGVFSTGKKLCVATTLGLVSAGFFIAGGVDPTAKDNSSNEVSSASEGGIIPDSWQKPLIDTGYGFAVASSLLFLAAGVDIARGTTTVVKDVAEGFKSMASKCCPRDKNYTVELENQAAAKADAAEKGQALSV